MASKPALLITSIPLENAFVIAPELRYNPSPIASPATLPTP